MHVTATALTLLTTTDSSKQRSSLPCGTGRQTDGQAGRQNIHGKAPLHKATEQVDCAWGTAPSTAHRTAHTQHPAPPHLCDVHAPLTQCKHACLCAAGLELSPTGATHLVCNLLEVDATRQVHLATAGVSKWDSSKAPRTRTHEPVSCLPGGISCYHITAEAMSEQSPDNTLGAKHDPPGDHGGLGTPCA
jgi:hypothetical protein